MQVLLSTTYFGPVQWYQKLHRADVVHIEKWESFIKQTYRNRCQIATTNGVQALTVPVERGTSPLIKDIRISDHGNWRHLHWMALQSAYGESPFFEYCLSLSIIRMTYVLSSRSVGTSCWTIMRLSARKCVNSSISSQR